MATNNTEHQHRRIWLLTNPRTASNLLVQMLNLPGQDCQVGGINGGYYFLSSTLARFPLLIKPLKEWTDEEMTTWHTKAQEDFDKFQDNNEKAAQDGKVSVTKEHMFVLSTPYYELLHTLGPEAVEGCEPVTLRARGVEKGTRSELNLTVLPDEFLKTMTPVFLLRHPAEQFSSLYRTAVALPNLPRPGGKPLSVEMTLKWTRSLYDFYVAHFGPGSEWPVVIDSDDIMTQSTVVKQLAGKVGLDPEKVRFEWAKKTEEELEKTSATEKVMLGTLIASDGVNKGKVVGQVDVDKEAVKWREEFGEEAGRDIEKWVREAMPDYEYLRSKRLTVD